MSAEAILGPMANSLRSCLLMSGTLAPIATTLGELGPSFSQRSLMPVIANHVVSKHSLKLVTVAHVGTTKLECTFQAWKRSPFLVDIGNAVLTLLRAIPGGVLVFLPSYELLQRCVEAWQQSSGDAKPQKRRGAVQRVVPGLDGS